MFIRDQTYLYMGDIIELTEDFYSSIHHGTFTKGSIFKVVKIKFTGKKKTLYVLQDLEDLPGEDKYNIHPKEIVLCNNLKFKIINNDWLKKKCLFQIIKIN